MDFIATPWGFGSIVAIVAAIVFIIWRTGNITLSKAGLTVGKVVKKPSPHSNCPHAKDIMELVHRTAEYMERKQELKLDLLEEQMRFYEETEEEVLGALRKIYLSLLSDKLGEPDSYAQHPEYIAYLVTLKSISYEVKSYLRSCFKANHYTQKSPEEQREYMERKKAVLVQKITDSLNMYWRGTIVTRSDLYKENYKIIEELERYSDDIFERAFSLARETDTKLRTEEIEYNKYITMMLGEQVS